MDDDSSEPNEGFKVRVRKNKHFQSPIDDPASVKAARNAHGWQDLDASNQADEQKDQESKKHTPSFSKFYQDEPGGADREENKRSTHSAEKNQEPDSKDRGFEESFYQSNGVSNEAPRHETKSQLKPADDLELASMNQQVNFQLSAFADAREKKEARETDINDGRGDGPEPSHAPPPVHIKSSGFFGFLARASRMYLLEFIVYVFGLSLTLFSVIYMVNSVLVYFGGDKQAGLFDPYNYQVSLYSLSLFTVVLPLMIIYSRRTRLKEQEDESVFSGVRRRFILYLFLFSIVVVLIFGSARFIYDIADQLISNGALSNHGSYPFWVRISQQAFSIFILGLTLIYFNWARTSASSKSKGIFFTLGLSLTAIVAAILLIMFPFNKQYGEYVDGFIERDISEISRAVENYAIENEELPDSLDKVEISAQVEFRKNKFGYKYQRDSAATYQLCAVFKTDTTNRENKSLLGAYYNQLLDGNLDPTKHKSGYDCFSYETSLYLDWGSSFNDEGNRALDNQESSLQTYDLRS